MKKASMIFRTVMIAIEELKKISRSNKFKGAVGDAITVIVMLYDRIANRKVDGELRLVDQWRSELMEPVTAEGHQSTDQPARYKFTAPPGQKSSYEFTPIRSDSWPASYYEGASLWKPEDSWPFIPGAKCSIDYVPDMTYDDSPYREPDWNAPIEMSFDGKNWFAANRCAGKKGIAIFRAGDDDPIIYNFDLKTRFVVTDVGEKAGIIRNTSIASMDKKQRLEYLKAGSIKFTGPETQAMFPHSAAHQAVNKNERVHCFNCDRPKPTNEDYKRTAKTGVDKSLCFVRGNTDCVEHTVDWHHRTKIAEEALRAIVERGIGASRKILLDELSTGSIPRQIAEKIYTIREELDSAAQLAGQVEQKQDSEKNHWCQVVANVIIDKLKG